MRKVIKKEQIRVDDARGALPSRGTPASSHDGTPSAVRILRYEGRVVAIECTCRCGERTTVELEYGELDAQSSHETPAAISARRSQGTPATETPEAR